MNFSIGNKKLSEAISQSLSRLEKDKIVERIWNKDFTVWDKNPDEISNRLGWLESVEKTLCTKDEIEEFTQGVIKDAFTHVLLMGMGGSSLAPEVFRLTFGVKKGYLDLSVLDSTQPDVIKEFRDKTDFEKTLFIISTKSGGTVETMSFMKFFYNETVTRLGKERAGNQFIAITDPESGLEQIAKELNFRKIFLNDPNIGGRYSALSLFGMVPAALVGVDLNKFLSSTKKMVDECKSLTNNSATQLGVILGTLANESVDKVTFITSPQIKYFGAWVEQLIAESTGKNGKGILPVDLEEILSPEFYSQDRMFVYLRLKEDNSYKNEVKELESTGFPVITIELESIYDLGKEYFRWEFATSVAGWALGIQPFDQPNVESAKVQARKLVEEYKVTGKLPELKFNFKQDEIGVAGNVKANNLIDYINDFLQNISEGKSYVAIQAYLNPDKVTTDTLQKVRIDIQKKYNVATTLGYGPRFLHSTGQLHKGDSGDGLFIQILAEPENDLLIPDNPGENKSSISFGVLIRAQALGDREAMLANQRKVLTIDLGKDIKKGLKLLLNTSIRQS